MFHPGAILTTQDLRRANLEGVNLTGSNLTDSILSEQNLQGTIFDEAKLIRTDLSNTILIGATLTNADLTLANLTNANLTNAILTGAILTSAILKGANLTGANLTGAILTRTNLEGVNLTGTNLTDSTLSGKNLQGIIFDEAKLLRTNLSNTNLTGAHFIDANLTLANLKNANLTNAELSLANLKGANLHRADLTNTELSSANLKRANLTNARIYGDLTNADLTDADLTDSCLDRANLTRTNLTRANLTNIQIEDIIFYENIIGADTIIGLPDCYNIDIFNRAPNIELGEELQEPNEIIENIIIPKCLLKIQNSSNNSCPNYRELYDFVMSYKLNNRFKFEYVGQVAVDVGGLKRDIFEKLLPVYTHKFFEEIDSNNDFVILKQNIDMNIFIKETEKMMFLSKAAKTFIFLKIDPRLLELLKSQKPEEFINNSKKESFSDLFKFFEKNIFELKLENQNLNEVELNGYFINNNDSNYFKNNNSKRTLLLKNQFQQLENSIKKEILFRRFVIMCGFQKMIQFQNMHNFIHNFWSPAYFVSELKFDIETFSKRIKISKQYLRFDGENTNANIPLESFGELSIDKTKFNFKENFNRNTTNLFTKYSILRPFLEFLLGTNSSDENRKLFISSVAGSAYYTGKITIKLSHFTAEVMRKPFKAATCFFYIEIYKSVAKENNGNLSSIINSIKLQLEHNKDFRWA